MRSMKALWQDVLHQNDSVMIDSKVLLDDKWGHSEKRNKLRFYFKFKNNQLYLTLREMQVIILLIDDMNIQKISCMTSLSIRTIEYYLGHIRKKFKYNRTMQVVTIIKTDDKLWQQYLDNKDIYFIKESNLNTPNN